MLAVLAPHGEGHDVRGRAQPARRCPCSTIAAGLDVEDLMRPTCVLLAADGGSVRASVERTASAGGEGRSGTIGCHRLCSTIAPLTIAAARAPRRASTSSKTSCGRRGGRASRPREAMPGPRAAPASSCVGGRARIRISTRHHPCSTILAGLDDRRASTLSKTSCVPPASCSGEAPGSTRITASATLQTLSLTRCGTN